MIWLRILFKKLIVKILRRLEMEKYIFRRLVVGVFLLGFAFISGCGKVEQESELQKVKIGYSRLRISLPVFVAVERGIFEKNGLNVELQMFDTAQPLMDALCAGHVEIAGYTAFPITFNAQLRSKRQLYYVTLMVEDNDHPVSMLIVKKGSPIKTIKDLRGKRIGILPTIAYKAWLEMILKENGIKPEEVIIQQIAPALTPSSLDSGVVDAMFTNDPAVTTTLQKGISVLLSKEALVPKYTWSPFPFGGFNMSREFADKNPDIAKQVVKSLDEAIEFVNKHPQEAKKIMANFLPDAQKPFVEYYPDARYLKSGKVSPEQLMKVVDAYLKMGIIKEHLDLTNLVYKLPR